MAQYDAIVVGAGLFGQIIADALSYLQNRKVLIIDRRERLAGSGPAACLMKPSWFSSMGRDVYEPSLKLLNELYGVHDISFTAGKVLNATVHWVRPDSVLQTDNAHYANVSGITRERVASWHTSGPEHHVNVHPPGNEFAYMTHTAPLVIVAAGVWTEQLLPEYRQTAQQGVAFLWRGVHIEQPFITPWAPYRQLVSFNRGDGIWSSDGTAIKHENWAEERERASLDRCRQALNRHTTRDGHPVTAAGPFAQEPEMLTGLRPYAKGHRPCLLEEVSPGLWVASGGAKNGTLAAGWCAHEIARRTA